ncbi:MAG: hypothetical protein KGL39_44900 [Patescibacteria group bacterium]|nr:hypothetical protein [Patescibacteria group bacterium]
MKVRAKCSYCGRFFSIERGALRRAQKAGYSVYCTREHAGLGRRTNRTLVEKKAIKADYDKEYRRRNAKILKKKKAAYFARTYDPVHAAIERKKRMPSHVEYCRQPAYKAKKRLYDIGYNQRQSRKDQRKMYHYTGATNPKDEQQWLSRNRATVRNIRRLLKSGKLYPEALSSLIARYGLEQISLT